MLNFWNKNRRTSGTQKRLQRAALVGLEPLEPRQLLHGGLPDFRFGGGFGGGFDGGFGGGFGDHGFGGQQIAFSLTPAAVQTGLDALATKDGLTDPAATDKVTLGNSNGVETYSITINGTGTVSRLTVDQLGDPVTAPTFTTTTWATLNGTGTGSDAAAAAEILAISTAKSLTAPVDTTTINVTTTSAGAVTYSVRLTPSNTTDSWRDFGSSITVDAAGNPVGQQVLPFSVFSSTIQTALNKGAPAGATALAGTSTQDVSVQTTDGVTTYSVTFTVSSVDSKVTVNAAGTLTSLPTTTTTTFGALSSSLQTELQTLATADGVTTTIASNQSINVLTETNGTVIYSTTLDATKTNTEGDTFTLDVTVAVDSNGNPTTLPRDGGGFDRGGFFGDDHSGNPGDCTNGGSTGSSTNSSSGSTSSNTSSAAVTLPSGGDATATSIAAASGISKSIYSLSARFLTSGEFGLASLSGYLVEFAPLKASTAVISDVLKLGTDVKQLATDTRALTAPQRKTLASDTKAINAAIKAMQSTLAPLEATLKTDAKTWAARLRADNKAIRKDRKNATALAADQAKLATDKASAFSAIVADVTAITNAISSNGGVTAAESKLATDLPTISADASSIRSVVSQLVTDLQA